MKKLQELFKEYKCINYDSNSKLEMRLDFDKEIENRKNCTFKDSPKNISGGGKLKIEGYPKLYVKCARKRIEILVHTKKKDEILSCTGKQILNLINFKYKVIVHGLSIFVIIFIKTNP